MTAAGMHDLAVIGAGPAGAATAFHAARAGLRVVLLDMARFPRDKICGDGLTVRAVAELQALGVEPEVRRQAALIRRFELSAPLGRVQSKLGGAGETDYAYVLPRLKLDPLLVQAAVGAGAELREQHALETWETADNHLRLRLKTPDGERSLDARYAVLACGAHLGPLMRMRLLTRKPAVMVAVRQYYENYQSDDDLWRLQFRRETAPGYGWVFPAGPGLANVGVALYANRDHARPAEWLEQYRRRTAAPLLRGALPLGQARSFPLRTDFLRAPLTAPRVLITGEAAGLVNPLTGEGIDYALESGRIAAEQARTLLERGGDGSAHAAALQARYADLFRLSEGLRDWCTTPVGISLLTLAAHWRPELKLRLIRVLFGGEVIQGRPTARRLLRRLLWPSRRGGTAA
ncbi:geranylgeranyl reductase family protein [Stagnimonas aquatica]|uniref:Protein CbrA n=1 Tax=Stagnimonas aquatica TaxID=2689987 RepID=A0A3N0VKR2_9GAMM|nr:geranylgeranyl reductase family protein [Stagnimonas aquatica]ROH93353.1 geranylgeranyl reductase family protein [Stagnimonas aquatica]